MGFVSLREDVIDRYFAIYELSITVRDSFDSEERCLLKSKLNKVVDMLDQQYKYMEYLEEFLTDPKNDYVNKALYEHLNNIELSCELRKYNNTVQKHKNDIKKLRDIIKEHEVTIKELKSENKLLRKKVKSKEVELNIIYKKYPKIGYEIYNKPEHKSKL